LTTGVHGAGGSTLATAATLATAVSDHSNLNSNVHGAISTGILQQGLFAQTQSVAVTANGTEGTLIGTGSGSVTLPANFFSVGKTIRVKASGFYTRTAGDDLRVRIYLGATTILDTAVQDPSTVTGFGWRFESDITCRTTGAPGTVMGQGRLELSTSATASANWQLVNTGAAIGVTTTGALAVNLTALWGGAGNSFTCTNLTIEAVN
jgi:hypothetical protein